MKEQPITEKTSQSRNSAVKIKVVVLAFSLFVLITALISLFMTMKPSYAVLNKPAISAATPPDGDEWTPTPTTIPSPTPTPAPSPTPTPVPTQAPSPTPTSAPSSTPGATVTPGATPTITGSPTASATKIAKPANITPTPQNSKLPATQGTQQVTPAPTSGDGSTTNNTSPNANMTSPGQPNDGFLQLVLTGIVWISGAMSGVVLLMIIMGVLRKQIMLPKPKKKLPSSGVIRWEKERSKKLTALSMPFNQVQYAHGQRQAVNDLYLPPTSSNTFVNQETGFRPAITPTFNQGIKQLSSSENTAFPGATQPNSSFQNIIVGTDTQMVPSVNRSGLPHESPAIQPLRNNIEAPSYDEPFLKDMLQQYTYREKPIGL